MLQRHAVGGAQASRAVDEQGLEGGTCQPLAKIVTTVQAGSAALAGGQPVDHHSVAGRATLHGTADRRDGPGALVAKDERRNGSQFSAECVQVRVANARCVHADQDLAFLRSV